MGKRGNPPPEAPAHEEGTGASGAAPSDRQTAASDTAPVVVTRLGGEQRIFPVGTPIRVGRDPSAELVSANPLVSRCHGVIASDEHGATYTDQSRRGTFINGKRLRNPLRITHSVILHLGDPATGEEVGITPPLSSTQIARNRRRKTLSGRMLAGVVIAVTVAAAALSTGLLLSNHPQPRQNASPSANSLTAAALRRAEAATVRLLIGSRTSYSGWGSGTLISSDGLILTNAHVAEPEAPGAAVAAGLPANQLGPNPPFLTVELTAGQSSAAVARFRARPVAVDGYLDLAVIRIYATSGGQPVTPASLHLPYLTLGNVG